MTIIKLWNKECTKYFTRVKGVDPDQTAPVIRVYTVCYSLCIFWTHYLCTLKPFCSNFRIITAFLWMSEFFICPVWLESSLSAWRNLGSLATHWVHSEDSDQPGRILVFAWRTSHFVGFVISRLNSVICYCVITGCPRGKDRRKNRWRKERMKINSSSSC